MKKVAVVVLTLALLTMLFAVLPAMAAAPEEKKVPAKVTFAVTSNKLVENITTDGNVSHRIYLQNWTVKLFIGDAETPIEGTAIVNRDTDYRYVKPGEVNQVINDQYVISFPTENGGFEGHSHSIITDWVASTRTYNIRVHVLLHGTGAFEGQTLNAWQNGAGTTPLWEGYLLKP